MTESGTGSESTSFVICADRPFMAVTIVPILPSTVVFAAASAASSSFVLGLPVAIPGGVLTPSAPKKFNAPLRRMAFVPIITPIKPTKPSDTAPRIMPREELSAAATTTIGMVAFNDGDALRFTNKFGPGLPEKLIVFKEDGEKLPDTDIDIERVGEIDKEFDILFVSDKDGLAVLPGEGETVSLAALDIVSDDDDDLVGVMLELKEIEELTVCDTLAVNDGDTLGDEVLDSVCDALDVKDGEILAVCVMDGVTEAIIHV